MRDWGLNGFWASGLGVWVSGFQGGGGGEGGVSVLGIRVLGFRVSDLGFRVSG